MKKFLMLFIFFSAIGSQCQVFGKYLTVKKIPKHFCTQINDFFKNYY